MTPIGDFPADDIELTDEQRLAVDCDAVAVLVSASAGTGKTEVVARRVERYVTDPDTGYAHVLAITYTTRAAEELRQRLRSRLGGSNARLTCETIHGFAHSVLQQHGQHVGLPTNILVLASDDDRLELLSSSDETMCMETWREALPELDLARANLANHPLLAEWRRTLLNAGAIDFAEMLAQATEVLGLPRIARVYRRVFGLVVVDEAQNLTSAQYQLITTLAGGLDECSQDVVPLVMLGDPKQSIVSYAGGNPKLMDRFATDRSAKRINLTKNFRSSRQLAFVANNVASSLGDPVSSGRQETEYAAEGLVESREWPNEETEASHVAAWAAALLEDGMSKELSASGEPAQVSPHEIAVLARTRAALVATANAMEHLGLETAAAHGGDDWASTLLGSVTRQLLLVRSPAHDRTAFWELGRLLHGDSNGQLTVGALTSLIADADDTQLSRLQPLLSAEDPTEFVTALDSCELDAESDEDLLAGWEADRSLIRAAWSSFCDETPASSRDWTTFALFIERSHRGRDLGRGIRLLTIHKAQGREFKAVAIVGLNDGQFPDFRARGEAELLAEKRAFYVAITRASRMLLLSRAKERPTRYGPRRTDPSPFLRLVGSS